MQSYSGVKLGGDYGRRAPVPFMRSASGAELWLLRAERNVNQTRRNGNNRDDGI